MKSGRPIYGAALSDGMEKFGIVKLGTLNPEEYSGYGNDKKI